MIIPIFLVDRCQLIQYCFLDCLTKFLQEEGLEPRTLGVTDYDVKAPLKVIRRVMLESNGLHLKELILRRDINIRTKNGRI